MSKDLMQVQLELEAEMYGAGILRFERNNQRSIDAGSAADADWFRRLTREFVKPMSDGIQAYIDYYKGRRGKPSACLMHLECLPTEASSYIAIKCIFDALSQPDVSLQSLANKIGRSIEDEIRFTRLENASPDYIGKIKESLKKRASKSTDFEHDSLVHAEKELNTLSNFHKLYDGGVDHLEIMRLLEIDVDKFNKLLDKKDFAIDFERWINFSTNDVLQLGAKMIDIFANNMHLDGQPLVCKAHSGSKHNIAARLIATDALEHWIAQYKEVMAGLSPSFEPCVVPPRKWTTPFNGGYHTKQVASRLNMVKCRNKKHLRKLTQKQMPAVYQAVNALQEVRWQIHPSVLAVANEIRLRALPIGMPSTNKAEAPICPVPAIYKDLKGEELKAVLSHEQREEFSQWKRAMANYHSREYRRKSDVREVLATIEQGLRFKDFEALHYVYTLDFRGRVYAQGNLISPQGNDLQKALIRFADAEPLGATGEYWFKVQGANVWGWDKKIFAERVRLTSTDEFKEMCLDIAADPITFTEWTKADKPWQFLAWCFEYAELLEWIDDGNPASEFLSRVAVAMDGSCSGIQHYSAMLRDAVGGKEVNLVPSDKPQDIYRAVSDIDVQWMEAIVEGNEQDCPIYDKVIENLTKKFEKAGASNPESAARVFVYKASEEWLRVGVNRSMTKKPVMTLPYGSSQMTCRESIFDYLTGLQEKADKKALASGKKLGAIHNFTNREGDLSLQNAVSMASMMTWQAIGEVVIAARAAMKYIKSVSNSVSDLGQPLEWTTPTGFIVHQAVFAQVENRRVDTQIMGRTSFRVYEDTKDIDKSGMASSAAPNFVHSMDASHLTLAVCSFNNHKLKSIAVIHDSFGTHAGKTELLRKLLIDSFVDMYLEHDVIETFKTENEERILVEIEVDVPEKGDLDLEIVRSSEYCFA